MTLNKGEWLLLDLYNFTSQLNNAVMPYVLYEILENKDTSVEILESYSSSRQKVFWKEKIILKKSCGKRL